MRGGDRRIRSVVVAGDGIAGWSAAVAVGRRIPACVVTCAPMRGAAPSMVDGIDGSAPSINDFHRDVGIDREDVLRRLGGSYRPGTRYAAYVHAFGPHGRAAAGAAFHHHWVRAARTGEAPRFDAFSVAAQVAVQGRSPWTHDGGRVDGVAFGLRLDPTRYRAYLRAYARRLGVNEGPPIVGIDRNDTRIANLRIDGGERLEADLYVDATGPSAALSGKGEEDWIDWSDHLPCDRVQIEPSPAVPLLDRVTTHPNGWRIEGAGQTVTIADDGDAAIRFRPGRRIEAWRGNLVAIGEAAVGVPPLEAVPLHLVHAHVDRLVALWPDRDFAAVELGEYNRETADEADRVRDYLIAMHHLQDRPEPFWRERRETAPPPLLAETLRLFRERGRLPIRDNETFTRDSWLALLLGLGVMPRRHDALADTLPIADTHAMLARLAAEVRATAERCRPFDPATHR